MGAYLLVDLLALHFWKVSGPVFTIDRPSDSTPALPVIAMAGVNLYLCLRVLHGFRPGEPFRRAWLMIALAAAAQFASGALAQLEWAGAARPMAQIAGGPVRLALLAAAMLSALRILHRFGFWVRPRATDWAVSGIVCLFTLCRLAEARGPSFAGGQAGAMDLIGLPLLSILFLEAMLLRQSVGRMGSGPIARCWTAFLCGIVLTGLAELALWVIPHYSQAWPPAIVESLTVFPTAAVFALAPAYQLIAQRWATRPAGDRGRRLATSPRATSPALP
jgi:hypothetical protein